MDEIIDKLSSILQEIESYHGTVHDATTYDHVKQLHQQARDRVAGLRKSIHELFQQATPIIEALAKSKPAYNDNSGYLECPYCPATSRTFTEPPLSLDDHHEDCPIRLATAWLEQWRAIQSESTNKTIEPGYYNIPVTQLKSGDIFCPPSGNPPGIITQIYRDPLTASNEYPLITFTYAGELCGDRICDIRQDQVVRVYRGELEKAELAWTAKYEVKDIQP